jgi:hypothetical protein
VQFRDSQDILRIWEKVWGSLPSEWRSKFLDHPAIPKILYFPDDWITQAVKIHIKLDDVLKLLQKSAEVHYPPLQPSQSLEEIETPEKYAERMKRLLQTPDIRIPDDDWWREQG